MVAEDGLQGEFLHLTDDGQQTQVHQARVVDLVDVLHLVGAPHDAALRLQPRGRLLIGVELVHVVLQLLQQLVKGIETGVGETLTQVVFLVLVGGLPRVRLLTLETLVADAQRQGVEVGPEGEVGHRTLCQVEHHGLGSTALRGLLLLVYPRYLVAQLLAEQGHQVVTLRVLQQRGHAHPRQACRHGQHALHLALTFPKVFTKYHNPKNKSQTSNIVQAESNRACSNCRGAADVHHAEHDKSQISNLKPQTFAIMALSSPQLTGWPLYSRMLVIFTA